MNVCYKECASGEPAPAVDRHESYSLSHLPDADLVRDLKVAVRRNCATTATELAHIAEFDVRKLYIPAAHPSMASYCVHVLHLSEGSARKRIHAARAAHQFPAIFEMVADGRLHLSAVVMLAPCLSPANAHELLEAATHRTKTEIERVLAQRFPRPSQPMFPPVTEAARSDDPCAADDHYSTESDERAPGRVQNETVSAATPQLAAPPARTPWPIAVDPADHEKLRNAQSLLRHQIPSGDLTKVLSRLIDLGLAELEKRKYGAGREFRQAQRPSTNPRHIPAAVKWAVWERDRGQCTFTSESGHRCPAREFIEFDHAEPVARGGIATIDNLRLRCRAHNQYEAERTFGAEFMKGKREAAAMRAREKEKAESEPGSDVIPWLRGLGIRIDDARRAAELCADIPGAPLEERVRRALSYFGKRAGVRVVAAV